jgi:hypothetical protein
MSRLVFSQNAWKSVLIPKGYDPSWNSADLWYYATMFAAAEAKGFAPERASVVAEAAVHKRLYPGLKYEKGFEQEISSITREEHERPE